MSDNALHRCTPIDRLPAPVQTFLIAGLFVVLGLLSRLLLESPGAAPAVFLAAGHAFAASVLCRRSVAITGIFTGAVAYQLAAAPSVGHWFAISPWPVILLAAGATVQGQLAAWLFVRQTRTMRLDSGSDILRILLVAGTIAPLVGTVNGVATIYLVAKTLPAADLPSVAATWWIGNALAIVLLVPLLWTVHAFPGRFWQVLRRVGLPTTAILGGVIALFLEVRTWEIASAEGDFAREAQTTTLAVRNAFTHQVERLRALAALVFVSPHPDAGTLRAFVERASPEQLHHATFGWLPRGLVRPDTLPADLEDLPWLRPDDAGETFAVEATAAAGTPARLAFDSLANAERLAAIGLAKRTGRMAATGLIPIMEGGKPSSGILLFEPVETPDGSALRGIAMAIVPLQGFVHSAAGEHLPPDTRLFLRDSGQPLASGVMLGPPDSGSTARRLRLTEVVPVGSRYLLMTIEATNDYARHHRRWGAWGVLVLGLLAAVGLGSFQLIAASRAGTVRRLVAERTRELEETNQQLALATRAKSEFLAHMSHEIRTPMNGVLGALELLRGTPMDLRQRRLVKTAAASGESLMEILNDVLDHSKIEAGKLVLTAAPMSLHAVVASAAALFRANAETRQLSLALKLGEGVPDAVVGDAARLKQVLLNLLGNAVKFTETGGITLKVDRLVQAGVANLALLRFSVKDTGIGIPPHALEQVFQPFHQVDSTRSRLRGGTGLGLAICQRIVQAMGGQIEVKSHIGVGSVFSFELALPTAPHAPPPLPDSEFGSLDASATLVGVLLLVEDNEVNRMIGAEMLKSFGLEVLEAEDGAQALAVLERQRVDLVLMDIQMPIMDGYTATRALREREQRLQQPRVPVVALTANAFDEDAAQSLAAGMDAHLAKPYSRLQLREVVQRWL